MSSTTRNHEADDETVVFGGRDILRLSESEELSILTGNGDEIENEYGSSLAEFEETLVGYQENSEKKEAWIRTFVPPTTVVDDLPDEMPNRYKRAVKDGAVAVEFMLPSRDYFWQTFEVPEKRWDSECDFARLLHTVSVSPGSLGDILGRRLNVTHKRNGWAASLDTSTKDTTKIQREKALVEWARTADSQRLILAVGGVILTLITGISQVGFGPAGIVLSILVWVFFSVLTTRLDKDEQSERMRTWSTMLEYERRQELKEKFEY